VIPPNQRKSLVSTGISGGDLAGIVIAWMFGLPALFFLVKTSFVSQHFFFFRDSASFGNSQVINFLKTLEYVLINKK